MKVKIFSNGISGDPVNLESLVNKWLSENNVIISDTGVGYSTTDGGYKYAIIAIWYEERTKIESYNFVVKYESEDAKAVHARSLSRLDCCTRAEMKNRYELDEKNLRQILYDTIFFYCDFDDEPAEEKNVLKAVSKAMGELERGNGYDTSKGKM